MLGKTKKKVQLSGFTIKQLVSLQKMKIDNYNMTFNTAQLQCTSVYIALKTNAKVCCQIRKYIDLKCAGTKEVIFSGNELSTDILPHRS